MTDGPDLSEPWYRRILSTSAFLAWMFAGFENQLFLLVHRQMALGLGDGGVNLREETEWFAMFQAAFLLGGAAGGWLFGLLGDRFGRTRAMGWSVLCYSLMTLVCYFVTNLHVMLCVRFLACLGFGGSWPNAAALVSEAWPRASRPLMAGVMGSAANFGMVLFAVIAWTLPISPDHWRWPFLAGAAPALLGVVILTVVPESRRWLNQKQATGEHPAARRVGLKDVFAPSLLRSTLLGIALGAVPVVGTAANANWIVPWADQFAHARNRAYQAARQQNPNAVRSTPIEFSNVPPSRLAAETAMLRSSGGIVGSLVAGVLAAMLGRRFSYFLISLLTFAVSTIVFTQLTPAHTLFKPMTFLLGAVGVAYFGWLPLFLPELFPTRVRATGSGISFNSGRIIAAIVTLFVTFLLTDADYAQIAFWGGMIYVVGMLVIWIAPATPAASDDGK